jgi:polyisoprenoid-binding protein YceI
MTAVTPTVILGYVAGTGDIDATHSDVSFSVRHLMVSRVRGRFNGVAGRLVMTCRSTGVHHDGNDLVVDGELILHGSTR